MVDDQIGGRVVEEDDLSWLPAWQLRALVVAREVSPVELVERTIACGEEVEAAGVRCWQELDVAGARRQAAAAERLVRTGAAVGPLHGVPVAVKANLAVAGLGVYPLFGEAKPAPRADRDAVVVRRLRESGAIVVGTTAVPGMGRTQLRDRDNQPSSDLGDHPRNPWDLGRVPGSSSSGSAAAVTCGVLPMALATDGGGSTRLPSAWCGIVGVHTTLGRVPMVGRAASNWNTSIGPMTRDARDAALALQALAGPDGATVLSLQDDPPDYLTALDEGVAGLRFGWTSDFGFASTYAGPESAEVVAEARAGAARLAELGATVDDLTDVWEDWWPWPTVMMAGNGVSFDRYREAEDARARWWSKLRRVLHDHDVVVSPTSQHVAFDVERWTDAWSPEGSEAYPGGSFVPTWTAHTFPHNWLGWPAVSIPCGTVAGMPVGLQLTGRPDAEGLLLRVADAYLRAFDTVRHPPVS